MKIFKILLLNSLLLQNAYSLDFFVSNSNTPSECSGEGTQASPWNGISCALDKLRKKIATSPSLSSEPKKLLLAGGFYNVDGLILNISNLEISPISQEQKVVFSKSIYIDNTKKNWGEPVALNIDGKVVKFFKKILTEPVSKITAGFVTLPSKKLVRLIPYECKWDLLALNKVNMKVGSIDKIQTHAKCLAEKSEFNPIHSDLIRMESNSNHSKLADTYMGAGYFFDKNENAIYIRLENSYVPRNNKLEKTLSDLDLFSSLANIGKISKYNPNLYSFVFSRGETAFRVGEKDTLVQNSSLKNIYFQGYEVALRLLNTEGFKIENVSFIGNDSSILIHNRTKFANTHLSFINSIVDGLFPKYVSWSDVKQGPFHKWDNPKNLSNPLVSPENIILIEKYRDAQKLGGFKPSAISTINPALNEANTHLPVSHHILVKNNIITNVFDGGGIAGQTHDWTFEGNTFSAIDDAIQLDVQTYNITFLQNTFNGPSISRDDTVYRFWDYTKPSEVAEVGELILKHKDKFGLGSKKIEANTFNPTAFEVFWSRPWRELKDGALSTQRKSSSGSMNSEKKGFVFREVFPAHIKYNELKSLFDPWELKGNHFSSGGLRPELGNVCLAPLLGDFYRTQKIETRTSFSNDNIFSGTFKLGKFKTNCLITP